MPYCSRRCYRLVARFGFLSAQPLRIETTRRVVLNTMFKKPGGGRGSLIYGESLQQRNSGGW